MNLVSIKSSKTLRCLYIRVMTSELIFPGIPCRLTHHLPLDGVWTQSKWGPHPIQWWMESESAHYPKKDEFTKHFFVHKHNQIWETFGKDKLNKHNIILLL